MANDDNKTPEAHLAMKARMKGGPRKTITSLQVAVQVLYPTPCAGDAKGAGPNQNTKTLGRFMKNLYPTPTVNDSRGGRNETANRKEGSAHHAGETLTDRVTKLYPSPRADGRDNAGGSNSRRTAKANGTYFGRKMNPPFVEWLMGFPLGWTDCADSATPSSRK